MYNISRIFEPDSHPKYKLGRYGLDPRAKEYMHCKHYGGWGAHIDLAYQSL